MNAKHTPGPWRVEMGAVIAFNGSQVTDHTRGMNGDFKLLPIDEREANGALIAAAPDLLAALQVAYEHINGGAGIKQGSDFMNMWEATRAAIAKATGGQS